MNLTTIEPRLLIKVYIDEIEDTSRVTNITF